MTQQELERKLAETQATNVILALPAVVIKGTVWRSVLDHYVEWEVKYLRMRGLLMHNEERPYLVLLRSTL